jgi:hypothetical protein
MPVAQWFCWQMGLTATVHTLGMILIFMPIMALDARRVKVLDPDTPPSSSFIAPSTCSLTQDQIKEKSYFEK